MITNNTINEQYNIFRNNVKLYRKNMSLTQEGLAEKSDLSISYIKQIESEKEFKNLSLIVILKLSKALDTSVDKLFEVKIKNV